MECGSSISIRHCTISRKVDPKDAVDGGRRCVFVVRIWRLVSPVRTEAQAKQGLATNYFFAARRRSATVVAITPIVLIPPTKNAMAGKPAP
jgi:hypothetical protein